MKLPIGSVPISIFKSQNSSSQLYYAVTLKGIQFIKCFARYLLSKQSVQGTESFYSGAHSLVYMCGGWGVGSFDVGDTSIGRSLTCRYNYWCMNNPLHFSNPTQHAPFPCSARNQKSSPKMFFSQRLRGREGLRNPTSNICNPDGHVKGRVFIRLGTGQEEI